MAVPLRVFVRGCEMGMLRGRKIERHCSTGRTRFGKQQLVFTHMAQKKTNRQVHVNNKRTNQTNKQKTYDLQE